MKVEKSSPKKISRLAIKGSVLPVINKLSSESKLPPELMSLKEKYQNRFSEGVLEKSSDSVIQKVIAVFENYWKSVLTERIDSSKAIEVLYSGLNDIAQSIGKDFGSFSENSAKDLSHYLKEKIEDEGYYSLWGRTAPHMEFMAWKKQTSKTYKVNIGENELVDVRVELLDDFISYGWLGYATFDELHTGGWATKEKLFCVASKYDLNSESFKISYLAHEGRHFADFQLFPKLIGTDLEYRAKLTELILTEKIFSQLLKNFIDESSDDRTSSHAYASYRLISDLRERAKSQDLLSVQQGTIKQFAKELLQEHTKKLNAMGAESVTSALSL